METPKILVAIPTMGAVHPGLMQVLENYRNCDNPRIWVVHCNGVQDHANARNFLVMYHFDPDVYTHLLMIDSDMVPPKDFIETLLKANRPVVTGQTHIWRQRMGQTSPEPVVAAWKMISQPDGTYTSARIPALPQVELFEEEHLATGTFCMLIQSEVIRKLTKLGYPFFKTIYIEETQEKATSEDIFFCKRLADAGYNVAIVPHLVIEHFKTVSLAQVESYGQKMFQIGLRTGARRGVHPEMEAVHQ